MADNKILEFDFTEMPFPKEEATRIEDRFNISNDRSRRAIHHTTFWRNTEKFEFNNVVSKDIETKMAVEEELLELAQEAGLYRWEFSFVREERSVSHVAVDCLVCTKAQPENTCEIIFNTPVETRMAANLFEMFPEFVYCLMIVPIGTLGIMSAIAGSIVAMAFLGLFIIFGLVQLDSIYQKICGRIKEARSFNVDFFTRIPYSEIYITDKILSYKQEDSDGIVVQWSGVSAVEVSTGVAAVLLWDGRRLPIPMYEALGCFTHQVLLRKIIEFAQLKKND